MAKVVIDYGQFCLYICTEIGTLDTGISKINNFLCAFLASSQDIKHNLSQIFLVTTQHIFQSSQQTTFHFLSSTSYILNR